MMPSPSEGFSPGRFGSCLGLLEGMDRQRADLDGAASPAQFGSQRQVAVSLLTDPRVRRAFDLERESPERLDRYGRNAFGWSLLMAYRLVEAGVGLVQVNLGNNETWDTHGNAFPHLKDNLFPPTDRALSALLDDLGQRGLAERTLLVALGEFGRTPRINKQAGRDHWHHCYSVLLAGGGVRPGVVLGQSDRRGAYPVRGRVCTPADLCATVYHCLGIDHTAEMSDQAGRPVPLTRGEPIAELL